jgi:DNA processing protein
MSRAERQSAPSGTDGLPEAAYAAALAGFTEMTVHRLLALLRQHPPAEAFDVASGRLPPRDGLIQRVLNDPERGSVLRAAWASSAQRLRPHTVWQRCTDLGLEVTVMGQPGHPSVLTHDALPVPVLFSRGDRTLLEGRRVALIGTRNATASGRHVARTLGGELAHAGVQVVSGLARGIDGAAHQGVFEVLDLGARGAGAVSSGVVPSGAGRSELGRPIAVVASGLDVVYPREHKTLWQRVGAEGLLLSEHPPGAPPVAHHFPLRNRMVAALSEAVVVVESRERGGSLITADLAAERGVPVMAVPGHVANRASLGANGLLRDGATPVLDVGDILIALALDRLPLDRLPSERLALDRRPRPRTDDLVVLQACSGVPRTIGEVARFADRPLLDVAMALARLEQAGWLHQVDGWYEALGSPPP